MQNQAIWLNSNVTVGQVPILWQCYDDNSIKFIGDLLNEQSEYLTTEEIHCKYGVNAMLNTKTQK